MKRILAFTKTYLQRASSALRSSSRGRSIVSFSKDFYDQQIHHLKRHLSISLMAFVFIGANLLPVAKSDARITQILPPSPEKITDIITAASQYTPTIQEDPSQAVTAALDQQDSEYIQQLVQLAADTSTTSTSNPLAGIGVKYTAQSGDSYVKIAAKFGLKPESVMAANGIDAAKIKNDPKALLITAGADYNVPAGDIGGPQDWLQLLNDNSQKKVADSASSALKGNSKVKVQKIKSSKSVALANDTSRPSSANGYVRGWCTYWAALNHPTGRWGNARTWYRNAKADGWAVGSEPRVGAIFQTNESAFGHVGIVTAVNGNSFTTSEMNYIGFNKVSSRTMSASQVVGFIY